MSATVGEFDNQADFVAWCMDEPHADIQVFRLEPAPDQRAAPARVTMEWGSRDLDHTGPGCRAYVWRLTATGVSRYDLAGEWSNSAPGNLRPHECAAPICVRMDVPGDLILECRRMRVEALGHRVENVERRTWSHYFGVVCIDEAVVVGAILDGLAAGPAAILVADDGEEVDRRMDLAAVTRGFSRTGVVVLNDEALFTVDLSRRRAGGFHIGVSRSPGADEQAWSAAWSQLPARLDGVELVCSGNVQATPEDWSALDFRDGLVWARYPQVDSEP